MSYAPSICDLRNFDFWKFVYGWTERRTSDEHFAGRGAVEMDAFQQFAFSKLRSWRGDG